MRNHVDDADAGKEQTIAHAQWLHEQRRAAEQRDVAEWMKACEAGTYDRHYSQWRQEN